jgi:hypothetical protein
MSRKTHTHVCRTCRQRFPCDGDLERNHDGWPEVICVAYHERRQDTCEKCAERDATPETASSLAR